MYTIPISLGIVYIYVHLEAASFIVSSTLCIVIISLL